MMRAKDYKKVAHVYYNYAQGEWEEHLKVIDPEGYQEKKYAQRAMQYQEDKGFKYYTELSLLILVCIVVNVLVSLLTLPYLISWVFIGIFALRMTYNLSELIRMDHYSSLLWQRELIFIKNGDRKV